MTLRGGWGPRSGLPSVSVPITFIRLGVVGTIRQDLGALKQVFAEAPVLPRAALLKVKHPLVNLEVANLEFNWFPLADWSPGT